MKPGFISAFLALGAAAISLPKLNVDLEIDQRNDFSRYDCPVLAPKVKTDVESAIIATLEVLVAARIARINLSSKTCTAAVDRPATLPEPTNVASNNACLDRNVAPKLYDEAVSDLFTLVEVLTGVQPMTIKITASKCTKTFSDPRNPGTSDNGSNPPGTNPPPSNPNVPDGLNPDDGPTTPVNPWDGTNPRKDGNPPLDPKEGSIPPTDAADGLGIPKKGDPPSTPPTSNPPTSIPGTDLPKINLKFATRKQFAGLYTGAKDVLTTNIDNLGPVKAERIVLESPDLSELGFSVMDVYASCPGTKAGATKIFCEWIDAPVDFAKWNMITVQRSQTAKGTPQIPLTATTYIKDPKTGQLVQSSQTTTTHTWEERKAPNYFQDNPEAFPHPRAMSVPSRLRSKIEWDRLNQHFDWVDIHTTGFYANSGDELKVTLSGLPASGKAPVLIIGTPSLVNPDNSDEDFLYDLTPYPALANGDNAIKVGPAGIIYIRYTNEQGEVRPDIKVELGPSAQPIPLFQEGVTLDAQWKEMLAKTKVPFAEVSGKRVIITGIAADASKFANQGQNQQELLDEYAKILDAQQAISGLSPSATDPIDRPGTWRPMAVQSRNSYNPNATNLRIAIPRKYGSEMWTVGELRKSWMVWHEFGHQWEHSYTWAWSAAIDCTTNIYSLAARRLYPQTTAQELGWSTAVEWANARKFVMDTGDKEWDNTSFANRLVMFEQLRIAFGDSFYHRLHQNSRRTPGQSTNADKKHYFMTQAAVIAGKNLTPYFTKWGMNPEKRTVDEMSRQEAASQDYTTVRVYADEVCPPALAC